MPVIGHLADIRKSMALSAIADKPKIKTLLPKAAS
jgi:hypothetical protein